MKERKISKENSFRKNKITRKEAIKKAGYTAFSAATMMLLLNDPVKGQQISGDSERSPEGPLDPFDGW